MTKGILELGWEKSSVYTKIAEKLIDSTDGIITSDKALIKEIRSKSKDYTVFHATDEINSFIKGYNMLTKEHDAVLIEGSMHGKVLNEIIDKN